MSELGSMFKAAKNEHEAALRQVKKAEGDPVKLETAMIRLGFASAALEGVKYGTHQKGQATRRERTPSRAVREAARMTSEVQFLEEGARLIEAGLELAEYEDSLEDWVDEAKDFLARKKTRAQDAERAAREG